MQSLEELKSSLAEYRTQLSVVASHLESDGLGESDKAELEQVKGDLVEVIKLTEDLVKDATQTGGGGSSGPPEPTEGERPRETPQPNGSSGATSSAAPQFKASSNIPAGLQEQIRRNQAKAALSGEGHPQWAVGHKCEAYRVREAEGEGGGGGDDVRGDWCEGYVRSYNAKENSFVVEFKDGKLREASLHAVRPWEDRVVKTVEEGKYAPVAAPKLRKATDFSTEKPASEVPKSLVIKPSDDERTQIKKKKILKSMKKKERFVEMDRKQNEKKSSWQSFVQGKGSKKKKGFMTGRKKESIFKTSESGRVGVTGSGKGMTGNDKAKRHTFNLDA
ncbi:hypothetical protein HOP50_14g71610 [Chloropicon primus]|uniref:Tudor domain-containing protein n=2 Tax=Chloropicon primus TaxID=1764295 RepID=A0A5B8MVP5_9CHLO|nr:hypothetical protein A3770_14p71410 [Chloropicon primus]UPR03831.1 hypothetical protein HOP50_14g71610 [Chloropicon primus]|eukprot:QDZ24623.1 hypothetical protein A3770_14p71410 [Chloropicon primus]